MAKQAPPHLVAARDDTAPPAARISSTVARARRGARAHARGVDAEALAVEALVGERWTILAQRLRTGAGEIDIVAERAGTIAFVEVKMRPTLAQAVSAITPRQQIRLLAAAEAALAQNPDWPQALDIRFDVIAIDASGVVRRVIDAIRQ